MPFQSLSLMNFQVFIFFILYISLYKTDLWKQTLQALWTPDRNRTNSSSVGSPIGETSRKAWHCCQPFKQLINSHYIVASQMRTNIWCQHSHIRIDTDKYLSQIPNVFFNPWRFVVIILVSMPWLSILVYTPWDKNFCHSFDLGMLKLMVHHSVHLVTSFLATHKGSCLRVSMMF